MSRLGQIDPGSGIIGDIWYGEVSPDFSDPNITYGPSSSGGATVPKPPSTPASVPGFIFPGNTVSALYPGGLPPGPSPRVKVPLFTSSIGLFLTSSTLITGVPNLVVLAGGGIGLALLSSMLGGGGRRRR